MGRHFPTINVDLPNTRSAVIVFTLLIRGRRSGLSRNAIWFKTKVVAHIALGRFQALDGDRVFSYDEIILDWILHLPSGQQVIVEYFGFAQAGDFGKCYAARKATKLEYYPTMESLLAFIPLERPKANGLEARKRELYSMLDRALAPRLAKP